MKIIKRIAVALVVTTTLATGIAILVLRRQQAKARSMIADLQSLQVGSVDSLRIREFLESNDFRSARSSNPPTDMNGVYETVIDNSVLARLHLAPWTRLGVLMKIEGRALSYLTVDYYTSCRGDMTSGVRVTEVPASPEIPPYQVWVYPDGGKPPNIRISITSSADPQERSRAFGLDIRCLSRIGGCSGASDLLPSAGKSGLGCETKVAGQ